MYKARRNIRLSDLFSSDFWHDDAIIIYAGETLPAGQTLSHLSKDNYFSPETYVEVNVTGNPYRNRLRSANLKHTLLLLRSEWVQPINVFEADTELGD